MIDSAQSGISDGKSGALVLKWHDFSHTVNLLFQVIIILEYHEQQKLIGVVANVIQANQLKYWEDSPRKMHTPAEALRLKEKDIYYWEFQCNGLTVQLASSRIGAVRVSVGFTRREDFLSELKTVAPAAKFFEGFKRNEALISTLKDYFKGGKPLMNVPWDIDATAFRHKVWKSVCTIPYGETRTYKDIAIMVGTPKGARAVARP